MTLQWEVLDGVESGEGEGYMDFTHIFATVFFLKYNFIKIAADYRIYI